MIDVVYYWSEDGEAERCKLEYSTADRDMSCYHCTRNIEKGSAIARLSHRGGDPYILHEECARKSCNFNPIPRVRPTKRLADYIKENNEKKEAVVRSVVGSMALSGFDLTEEDKQRIRDFAFDPTQIDRVIASLVSKHTRNRIERKILDANVKRKSLSDLIKDNIEGMLTWQDIINLFEGLEVFVIQKKHEHIEGEWKTFDYIYSFMDINDVLFTDETSLSLEEYGETWLAYYEGSVVEAKQKYIAELKERMGINKEKNAEKNVPNKETISAIEEGRHIAMNPSAKGYTSVEELREALNKEKNNDGKRK